LNRIFQELRRRHVFKAAISYIVVAWVFLQAAAIIFPLLSFSSSVLRGCLILLIIGFPFWLVFAYFFDISAEGIKRTEDLPELTEQSVAKSQRQTRLIIGGLSLAVVLLVADRVFNLTDFSPVDSKTKTIAVLPFQNLSGEEDNAFFTTGMHEDVMGKLAALEDVRVICRTSVSKYKDYEGDLDVVAERLGADYVMEGSVRRADDQVRITAQLIDASTNRMIWSESYDRKLEKIFELQSSIAREIAGQMQASITSEESLQLDAAPTVVMAAYDSYLKAREIYNESWVPYDRLMEVIGLLEEAVLADQRFAAAWALLCEAQSNRYSQVVNFDDREQESETARQEAERALNRIRDLDPEGLAYFKAEAVYNSDVLGNRIETLRSIDKALAIQPDDPEVLFLQAFLTFQMGDLETSVSSLERSYQVDPENGRTVFFLTMAYEFTRQHEKIVPFLERLLKLEPERTHYGVQAKYYQFLADGSLNAYKDFEEAVRTVEKTDECDVRTVQNNEMVVAMFNDEFADYAEALKGKWNYHHRDHGNWSCPMILNEEANHAKLIIQHGENHDLAHDMIHEIRNSTSRPVDENSLCIFNKAVYEPKLDIMEGDSATARRKFDEIILEVIQNEKFPRGAVERVILLQTADMVAPDRVYSIYRQVSSAPISLIGMETICADPWTYPNLIRDPQFIAEVKEDGRFTEFLEQYGFL
jgi:TolB-like protein